MTRQILPILVALGAMCAPTLAAAAVTVEEGSSAVSVFGGWYRPKSNGINNDSVVGIRGARGLSENVITSGSLGYLDYGPGRQTLLDVNVAYGFQPFKRLTYLVTGGLGYAFIDNIGKRDSFTMNVGVGPAVAINHRVSIRLVNRFRWFHNRDNDNVDQEITIALVAKLGQ